MFEVEVLPGGSWRKKKNPSVKVDKIHHEDYDWFLSLYVTARKQLKRPRPRRSASSECFMAASAPLLPERTSACTVACSAIRNRKEFVRLQPITAGQCFMTHLHKFPKKSFFWYYFYMKNTGSQQTQSALRLSFCFF